MTERWPRGMREEIAAEYVGLSPSTLRKSLADRDFPEPVRLTPGRIVWMREDLDAYLDRKAGRSPVDVSGEEWLRA